MECCDRSLIAAAGAPTPLLKLLKGSNRLRKRFEEPQRVGFRFGVAFSFRCFGVLFWFGVGVWGERERGGNNAMIEAGRK